MHPPVYPPGITPPPPLPGSPPDLKGTLGAADGEKTKLTIAAPAPPLQFGTVEATLGDLKAHCRVRVAPRLPFTADFSKVPMGRTPAAWVNTQGKFSVIAGPQGVADHPIFSKRNNQPNILVARANAYIGAPTLSDYTIEVDEYATKVKTDLPDMGCRQLPLRGDPVRQRSEAAPQLLERPGPGRGVDPVPLEAGRLVSPEAQGDAAGRQGAGPGQGLCATTRSRRSGRWS